MTHAVNRQEFIRLFAKISTKTAHWLKALARLSRLPCYIKARYMRPSHSSRPRDVLYIIEGGNWSIKWDGINICRELNGAKRRARVDTSPVLTAGKILHYGSSYAFESKAFIKTSGHNKLALTFFHGKYGDDPLIDKRFDMIMDNLHRIDAIAVSTSIMHKRFLELGVPESKLFLVPIGVDLEVFKPLEAQEKATRRKKLGIPDDAFVIGSFQKDGEGWDAGLEPKMIKGPDIFIETVKRVHHKRRVFCLLSGPARGYVKRGLEEAGIAYHHEFFDNPDDVAQLYQLLDAYVVTSREEGGPKAIMESMACGVPLVTTDVGMARDVIEGHDCGVICDVEDVSALSAALEKIASDRAFSAQLVKVGMARVQSYSWSSVAKACEAMYKAIDERSI